MRSLEDGKVETRFLVSVTGPPEFIGLYQLSIYQEASGSLQEI